MFGATRFVVKGIKMETLFSNLRNVAAQTCRYSVGLVGLFALQAGTIQAQEYFSADAPQVVMPTDVLVHGPTGSGLATFPSMGMSRASFQEPAVPVQEPVVQTQEQDSPGDVIVEPVQESDEALIDELTKRIESLEKDVKKAQDAEKKKKEEDASKPSIKVRGRIHADSNWFGQTDASRLTLGDIQDAAFMRRARIGVEGKIFEVTDYRIEMDFAATGRPTFTDVYGRVGLLPRVGNIQLGHFREPFSLEALTSSNYNVFRERAVFDQARNWGIMAFDWNEDETVTWAFGVFRDGSDNFGDDIGDSGERSATGRVTWLPYFDEPSNGRHFFEVGASYSYRDPDNTFVGGPGGAETSIVRFSNSPMSAAKEDGVGSVPPFVAFNVTDASDVQLVGLESTWNVGSLNFQAEYMGGYIDRLVGLDAFVQAGYFQTSYFLTGESRQWDRKYGYYTRAQVFENFFRVCSPDGRLCCGRGAWEAAARVNYFDLNDGGLNGGYMNTWSLGLNWYLSPYTRMMFDYSLADLHDPVDGQSNTYIAGMRLDIHF